MKCGTNRDAFTAPRAHFERDTDRRAYESDKIRNDLVGNPSGIASDSRGNVYTGEQHHGKRVQKFVVRR